VTGEAVSPVSGWLGGAALVILVLSALALTSVTARWVVGHPERIRVALAWAAQRPAVSWVRSRYPRQWRFVGRRFAPGEAAGLALTLGLAAVLALGVSFGQILDHVLDGEGVAMADHPVTRFLAEHREPWLITIATVITDMGSPVGATVLATVVGVTVARIRRSWLPLVVMVLGAGGIGLINMAVKRLVSRDRPSLSTAVVGEDGFSFPSGHTVGTTVVWLLSAWMIGCWVIGGWSSGRRAGRTTVWTAALLMIIAVGTTRVFLGVHYPSDVLAAWVLGGAWAVTVALVANVWQQSYIKLRPSRRAHRRSALDRSTEEGTKPAPDWSGR
jgi:membrane-associated phospholipid phosphatase